MHGRRDGLERAPVKTAAQAHDRVTAVADTLGVQASELHRTLICLRTRVRKECLPHLLALRRGRRGAHRLLITCIHGMSQCPRTLHIAVGKLGDERRHLASMLDIEVVRHVRQRSACSRTARETAGCP